MSSTLSIFFSTSLTSQLIKLSHGAVCMKEKQVSPMFLQVNNMLFRCFNIRRGVISRLNLHSLHSTRGQHFAYLPSNTKFQLSGFRGTATLEPDKIGINGVNIIDGIWGTLEIFANS